MAEKRVRRDTETGDTTPPKKKKAVQYFRQDYALKYPGINKSLKGNGYAHCGVCICDFSISHGGDFDIRKHLKTTKHEQSVKFQQGSKVKIDSFFVKSDSKTENDVTNAECLFTSMIVEHNLPIALADHATKLFRKMFPDSEIAKKYACSRTKTAAIINEMASSATEKTVSNLKSKMFNLSTDGSNDVDSKLYPIVVSYFDDEEERVVNMLLSNPNLMGKSTGENICSMLREEFTKKSLNWENVVSLGVDNANVMIGTNKGLAGCLLKLNSNLIIRGCPCHLLHLAAEKAANKLHYQFDEILIDIYYYLDKSANRKQELSEFQNLCDTESHRMLKHVCTRWLSLGKCLDRLIEQWLPLKKYFTSKHDEKKKQEESKKKQEESRKKQQELKTSKAKGQSEQSKSRQSVIKFTGSSSTCISTGSKDRGKEKTSDHRTAGQESEKSQGPGNTYLREERLYKLLTSRRCVVYALFLNNCIQTFDRFNLKLQSEEPLIHCLQRILLSLFKELLCRLVKPKVITDCSDILEIDYKDKRNILKNEDLVVGYEVDPFLQKLDNNHKLSFYEDVKIYYQTALDYMKLKFPLKDVTLKHAEVADVGKRKEVSMKSVEYFAEKFKPVLSKECTMPETLNCLQRQFLAYQTDPLENIDLSEPVNKVWCQISKLRDELGQLKYETISTVMKSILVIPHSNASCERIFSLVRKNRTDFRGSLSNQTLESILIRKQEMTTKPCYTQTFDSHFLKRAKSSAYTVNK